MDATTNGIRPTRRRALTAAICSVAVIGGALISVPAYAETTTGSTCATTQLLSTDGSGVVDVSSGGLTIHDPHCGTTTSGTTATPTPTPTAGPTTATPEATPTTPTTAGSTSSATTTPATARTAAASSAVAGPLSHVSVQSSTDAVYPVRDGYLDGVRFEIRALGSSGQLVPVQGTAILSKSGMVAHSWTIDTSTTVLNWDGRVGGTIRRGVYTLHVTLYSTDGSTKTVVNRVRVLTKHVERRAITVRSRVRTNDSMAAMPAQVLKAYAKGPVTVAVRTVAKVTGPAKLLFSNDGIVRTVPLRNGTHTGTRGLVPVGFESVTITHRWAKGAAKLRSIEAIWTYYTLVS